MPLPIQHVLWQYLNQMEGNISVDHTILFGNMVKLQ